MIDKNVLERLSKFAEASHQIGSLKRQGFVSKDRREGNRVAFISTSTAIASRDAEKDRLQQSYGL